MGWLKGQLQNTRARWWLYGNRSAVVYSEDLEEIFAKTVYELCVEESCSCQARLYRCQQEKNTESMALPLINHVFFHNHFTFDFPP